VRSTRDCAALGITVFTPEQLRPLLEALCSTQAVVVGGQAINLWSQTYAKDEEPWNSLRPFTSRDLDVLGSTNDLHRCARRLQARVLYPEPGQSTINTGKLLARIEGREVEADFLSEVKGLNNQEVRQTAKTISWRGLSLRILHPLLCVESKTASLMRLPQDVEGRQDKKHLVLALANAREFLAEQTANTSSHPNLVRWAERLRSLASDQVGLEAALLHGIDYRTAIPAGQWREAAGCLGDFIAEQWEPWREEVREKVEDLRQLEDWLRQLKNTPSTH